MIKWNKLIEILHTSIARYVSEISSVYGVENHSIRHKNVFATISKYVVG